MNIICSKPECQTTAGCKCFVFIGGVVNDIDFAREIQTRYHTFDSLVETRARADYEASRKRVAGRPTWERLNPHDPYDMGMRQIALDRARGEIINSTGYQAEDSGND